MSNTPVPIDAVTKGVQPGPAGTPTGSSSAQTLGPFKFGANLYILLTYQDFVSQPTIFKSTDGGATWAAVAAGTGPPAGNTCCWGDFDGLQTIRACYTQEGSTSVPITVQDFDLNTETWGGTSTSGFLARSVFGCTCRPNGSLLIFYGPDPPVTPPSCWAVSFASGSFNSPFQYNPAGAPASNAVQSFQFVTDPATGVTHLLLQAMDNLSVGRFYYQPINQDDSLGTAHLFGDGSDPLLPTFGFLWGPAIAGNNLVWAVVLNTGGSNGPYATVYLGTPLSAPVWTLLNDGVGIDSGTLTDPTLVPDEFEATAACDGTTLYIVYSAATPDNNPQNLLRLCKTTNLANPALGWTASTFFNGLTDGGPGWQQGQMQNCEVVFSGVNVTIVNPPLGGGGGTKMFWIPGTPAPPTLVVTGLFPTGSVGFPYTTIFVASGGTPPYTYTVSLGSLPPGLSLDPVTGIVSGTPTQAGTFCFTVLATDSLGATGTLAGCIVILAPVSSLPGTAHKCDPMAPTTPSAPRLDWSGFVPIIEAVRPAPLPETQCDNDEDAVWRSR